MATADPDGHPCPIFVSGLASEGRFACLPSQSGGDLQMYIMTLISSLTLSISSADPPRPRPLLRLKGEHSTDLHSGILFFHRLRVLEKHKRGVSFSQWCYPISVIHSNPHLHQPPPLLVSPTVRT